jgi:tetratricopeptide (TPR) repeat protein
MRPAGILKQIQDECGAFSFMRSFIFITLSFCLSLAKAQSEREIDSLKNLLSAHYGKPNSFLKDSIIGVLSIEIARQSSYFNNDSNYKYANIALKFAEKARDRYTMAKACHQIGIALSEKNRISESNEIYKKGIKLLTAPDLDTNHKALRQKGKLLDGIGLNYWAQGKFTPALEYFFEALRIGEKLKRKKGIASTLSNIGLVYSAQGKHQLALDYYRRSLALERSMKDKHAIPVSLGNIGQLFSAIGEYDSAFVYLNEALTMNKNEGFGIGIAYNLSNIANIYERRATDELSKKDKKSSTELYTKALEYNDAAIEAARRAKDEDILAIAEANKGNVLMSLGNYKEAELQMKKALALTREIKKLDLEKEICFNLHFLFEKTGKFEESLKYHKAFTAIKDTLTLKENVVKQTKLEMQYDFDKKTAVEELQKQKEETQRQSEAKKQKLIFFFTCFILLLSLLFSIYFFRNLKRTKSQNKEISRQKKLVDEKQKEILDSIQYAKRIQTAHLPNEKVMNRNIDRLKK